MAVKYTIKYAKSFKKGVKKLNDDDKNRLFDVIEKLANGEVLDAKYKDHKMLGVFKDFRNCHVRPDLILLYQKQESELILTCIEVGSHSELFKK